MSTATSPVIRVFYAEDEPPAREKLNHQLGLIPGIEVVGFATNGKQAIASINQLRPDVVLLDIQMPEINGIDLVDLLEYKPIIIYTTAYDKFAIQAFEQSSVDYLLKPYPLARLKQALDKATERFKQQQALEQQSLAPAAYELPQQPQSNKLVSKQGERILLLSLDQLMYIKSEQGHTQAWDGHKFHPLAQTLDQLEQALPAQTFIRIHRGYLVNVEHIKEIQRWFNGKLMLIINDEPKSQLSTSRAGADKLKQVLGF